MIIGCTKYVQASTLSISSQSFVLSTSLYKTLYVYGSKAKVTWSTSNSAVAAVSAYGRVTAKASGTATICANVSGKKIYSKVTVIKLNVASATLASGTSKTLKVYGTSSKVTWTSSNKAIAVVSSGGKVTAKKTGTATITASVLGKKLSSKITVIKKSSSSSALPPSTKVIGYYAAWSSYTGYTPDQIDAMKLTHINYAFANIGNDFKITLGYPNIDPDNISKLNQLKLVNPKLKTIISVGGWTWSDKFSDVALTEKSRAIFADSCVDFIVKYGFDGVDLDWEYPVSGGVATNVRRPEDKTNFTLILKTLREKLDARGKVNGKKYIVTFAGAAGSWYTKNVELSNISQYVDYANIMSYDIHGPWESYTNFNAPLYSKDLSQPSKISVDSCVQDWLMAGFPKDKLVMGVPFYGFIYKAVVAGNQGLFQTYSGSASIGYNDIVKNYLSKPEYIRYYHSDSRVPWLFNGSTFITYEDEQSIGEKARYIKTNSLGGAMIWELGKDPNKVLLNALYQELSQ